MKKCQVLFVICLLFGICYAAAPQMPPAAVNVVTAKAATWQKTVVSTGTLIPDQGVTIKSDIAGRITEVFFKSGTHVEKGQPIVQIFPNILQAQLKQNQANLTLTKLTYDRMADLYKRKVASGAEYDTASANYQAAQAVLDQTQAQLDQTLIKAPFSGYLGIRQINVGDYLSAGAPIVNLENTNPMFVDFTVPEVFSKEIKIGQKVDVTSQTYGKQIFTGTVTAIESLIDPNTRTLNIRATFPNENNVLIPGSFVITTVYVGEPKQLITLPQTAIVYSEQGNYVYVVKDGKAVKTLVQLGERGDANIFITSGLTVGEEVVTAGQQRLHNGASVAVEATK